MTQPVTTDLRQQITDLLADIARGGTADSVATILLARQIKGRRDANDTCPIANLLKTLPTVEWVAVLDGHALVRESSTPKVHYLPLPEPVSAFIYLFDQGVFLALAELPAVSA